MPTRKSFEADFDTPEFLDANLIRFDLRREEFTAHRIPLAKFKDFQSAVDDARDKGTIELFDEFFRWVLPTAQHALLMSWIRDDRNPVRDSTITDLVAWITSELRGGGDAEDGPKDDDSEPSPSSSGQPSTTPSPEISDSTPSISSALTLVDSSGSSNNT